jgi:hypothetical protein
MKDQLDLTSPLCNYDDYDIKIPPCISAANVVGELAQARIIYDKGGRGTWYKEKVSKSCHRIFANTYSSANHLAMRGELSMVCRACTRKRRGAVLEIHTHASGATGQPAAPD